MRAAWRIYMTSDTLVGLSRFRKLTRDPRRIKNGDHSTFSPSKNVQGAEILMSLESLYAYSFLTIINSKFTHISQFRR